jgi:transposase InsO family protein
MSQRVELVGLMREGNNVRELCRRFGVSPTTAYKWMARCDPQREHAGLEDRSRRPKHSPLRSAASVEAAVVKLRREHPAWGGRKLGRVLRNEGMRSVPAASTITAILRRHELLDGPRAGQPRAWQRFEAAAPNDLWQLDFKGHFAIEAGRCHPLTLLDDHSRYSLALQACDNERTETVRPILAACFRRYGLPRRILCDNGSPWGDTNQGNFTPLTVWLLRLGVGVSHGRPYHPQTQGKLERFHESLIVELVGCRQMRDLAHCQQLFDPWRHLYNHKRPHEALGLDTPAQHYSISSRRFPQHIPEFDYGQGATVRRVQQAGFLHYANRSFRVPKAFAGQRVALRPTLRDGIFDVFFCHQHVSSIDLRDGRPG